MERLQDIFSEVLEKWDCEFAAEQDHVHFLLEAHPALDLSRLIGNLKTLFLVASVCHYHHLGANLETEKDYVLS